MFRTRLCDLLGIDVPIILAGMGRAPPRLNSPPRSPMKAVWAALGHSFGPPT